MTWGKGGNSPLSQRDHYPAPAEGWYSKGHEVLLHQHLLGLASGEWVSDQAKDVKGPILWALSGWYSPG